MSKFRCPRCGLKCQLNKKLSEIRDREEKDRIYFWECPGIKADSPHAPTIYKQRSLSFMTDAFGRITSTIDELTQLTLEDSNIHELMDQWKDYMSEERYKRLNRAQMEAQAE